MNSSESAEEIVKMSLEGVEVAARITGQGAERIAVLLYTMLKNKQMTKGKTKLNNMLKSGSNLQIFSIKEEELKKFHEQSKQYGVLYTALFDKKNPNKDGMVDIMVREEDAPKVNRIVERFNLSIIDTAKIKSEIEKDEIEGLVAEAKEKGTQVKSNEEQLAEDIMTKPIQKEENENSNPEVAKTEESPLSEPSLENKENSGVVSKQKKPSVRAELNNIKEKIKDIVKHRKDKQDKEINSSQNISTTEQLPNLKKNKEKER